MYKIKDEKQKNMFKKIVSNLPFSPALVGQLSLYSKTLKREELTRRLGIIFIASTVIVQSLILLNPTNPIEKKVDSLINSPKEEGIVKSIHASNLSQGFIDANNLTAQKSDQISYTLSIENTNENNIIMANFEIDLSDALEYSVLVDKGGGTINSDYSLSWPLVSLEPKTKQTRTYTLRILDEIPANAINQNNPNSYDCILRTSFGDTIDITLERPFMKNVESFILLLPPVNQIINLTFSSLILITSFYFYVRSRQFEKEIRLIRKDVGNGTI